MAPAEGIQGGGGMGRSAWEQVRVFMSVLHEHERYVDSKEKYHFYYVVMWERRRRRERELEDRGFFRPKPTQFAPSNLKPLEFTDAHNLHNIVALLSNYCSNYTLA